MSRVAQQPVDALRSALPPGRVDDFDVSAADRTGVPVCSADFVGDDGPRAWAFGYGTEPEQARTGAFGELAEEVLLHLAVSALTPRRATPRELRRERGERGVVDPLTLVLPAGGDYHPDRPLNWFPTTRWRTGETVLVPAEFCAAASGDLTRQDDADRLITPITNGLGAGVCVEQALTHALLELLQRDGNATAYRAMDRGVVIELDAVTDPVTRELWDRLAAAGIEVLPKIADTQFDIADVYVVGVDTDPGCHPLATTGCGEAAHPDREVALRKALCEYAASRARKVFAHGPWELVRPLAPASYWERELSRPVPPQEPRAFAAMREWLRRDARELRELLAPTVLSRAERVPFSALPHTPFEADPGAQLHDLLGRLAEFDVLVLLAPGVGGDGAVAVKAIVPGLEVETMSYGRIGERGVARLLERGSELVGLGPPRAGARPVPLTDAARDRLGGPAWLDTRAVDRTVGPLYPLYREPDRHAVARAQL